MALGQGKTFFHYRSREFPVLFHGLLLCKVETDCFHGVLRRLFRGDFLEQTGGHLIQHGTADNKVCRSRRSQVVHPGSQILPVLGIRVLGQASDQGELDIICKTRGEHGVLERMILEMKARGFANGRVQIAHCDNEKAARRLKLMIEAIWPDSSVEIVECGALCSFYAELGGLLVGYEDAGAPAV